MPPYKKQIVTGDVPQLKPFDYSRQLDSIANDMGELSQKTAKIAEQNFLNTFELESRQALADAYDRNQNQPEQLQQEQTKIMQKFVSALPTKEMREEAKLKFNLHAMGYLGKAKENLYNQQYRELQATTLDKTNTLLNDIQHNGKDLYNSNLGVSGTATNVVGSDIVSLEQMLTQKDERGNMVLSPERQASLRAEVRKRLTASDLDHFNDLGTLADKEKFYKEYKDKKTQKVWLDPKGENGYGKQKMNENNTDWPTYEHNLKAMEKTLEVAKQESLKGMAEEEKNQFAVLKIKELERLDVMKEELAPDGKVNPYRVFAFLQQVNDLATNDQMAFKRKDGQFSYYLEPSEAYKYKTEVLKYWNETLDTFQKQNDNTNFSYGLKRMNQLFEMNKKFHGLNEFDKMDLMQEYYRQISTVLPPDKLQGKAHWGFYNRIDEAVKRAMNNYVINSPKFNEYSKNMILSTPEEIKTHFIAEESPLPGRSLPNMKL